MAKPNDGSREAGDASPRPKRRVQTRAEAPSAHSGASQVESSSLQGKPFENYLEFRNALGAKVAAMLPFSTPRVVPASVDTSKADSASVAYLPGEELTKIDLLSVLQAHRMLVATGRAREFEMALSKLVGVEDYKVHIHPHIANLIADHISVSELAETARTMSAAWMSPRGFTASAADQVVVPTKPPDWIIPDPKR